LFLKICITNKEDYSFSEYAGPANIFPVFRHFHIPAEILFALPVGWNGDFCFILCFDSALL